jgi:hypothetical protein
MSKSGHPVVRQSPAMPLSFQLPLRFPFRSSASSLTSKSLTIRERAHQRNEVTEGRPEYRTQSRISEVVEGAGQCASILKTAIIQKQ